MAAFSLVEWLGIAVFALTGALTAARKAMDPFGFVLLGTVTGIGGGTLRDVLLGVRPVFWITDPADILICAIISLVTFFTAHRWELANRARLLLWADAVGLSVFCVTGAAKALAGGAGGISAVVLGIMSATFGGILRDVLAGDVPLVLRRDIYVTAALVGSASFVLALPLVGFGLAALAGFLLCFVVRGFAIRHSWSLPQYGRLGRKDDI